MSSMLAGFRILHEYGLQQDAVVLIVDSLYPTGARIVRVPAISVNAIVLFAGVSKVLWRLSELWSVAKAAT